MYSLAQVIADNDGSGHMNGWGGGWMWLWGTLMMLFWVAVIVSAAWLFTRNRDQVAGRGANRAHAILDERYARGELSTDEYRERVDHLR